MGNWSSHSLRVWLVTAEAQTLLPREQFTTKMHQKHIEIKPNESLRLQHR
jgi:hypothetical protein